MIQPVKANEIFSLKAEMVLVDVRSPAEFLQGHIPGAVNIPLFSDSERAEVGTRYKQAGKDAALLVGLDFVGIRMSDFVKKLHVLCRGNSRQVAVYCWRGGMRSASMAWLFSTAGYSVCLLEGGYKAYRAYIREEAGKGVPMIVLGGMTGSGKTEILRELKAKGEKVIDLEHLASNKGSVFGYLGQPDQPTNEQFENNLADAWLSPDNSGPVWIEDESRSIGAVSLPGPFFERMKHQPLVLLHVPVEKRVERLIAEYTGFEKSALTGALMKIAQPIGGQGVQEAAKSIGEGNFDPAIRLVLGYYDKMYIRALAKFNHRDIINIETTTGDAAANAALILKHITGNTVT